MSARTHPDRTGAHLAAFALTALLLAAAVGTVAALGPGPARAWTLAALALAQVAVALRLSFHLDLRATPRENLIALLFTAVLIGAMVGGTALVMGDLRERMMPQNQERLPPRPRI